MKIRKIYLLILFCITVGNSSYNISVGQNKEVNTELIQDNTIDIKKSIETIEDFYTKYTTNLLSNASANNLLVEKVLTKSLQEKVDRMRSATNSDPIIRAQDFREDLIETLKVKHMDGNWFMVSYNKWDGSGQIHIPLRVIQREGKCMIDYITPEWNGTLYGDSLLFDNPIRQTIDNSSSLSFLKSFYAIYTMEYCGMPENLASRLEVIRTEHLTTNALKQFNTSVGDYKMDGQIGYDLIIDYFDFDCMWLSSIKYTQLDKNNYQVRYKRGETNCSFILKILKQKEKFKIESIRVEFINNVEKEA